MNQRQEESNRAGSDCRSAKKKNKRSAVKIYTKSGDKGTTALIGGQRVVKHDPRVEAYGSVDELAAHLALLCDTMEADGRFEEITDRFEEIQKELFAVEAMLAVGGECGGEESTNRGGRQGKRCEGLVAMLPESAVERLEREIDETGEGLPPVEGFIIPGGHPIVSMSNVCRTVCRRAERIAVRAQYDFRVPEVAGAYLNRLSDWLYVVGRRAAVILSIKERYWKP